MRPNLAQFIRELRKPVFEQNTTMARICCKFGFLNFLVAAHQLGHSLRDSARSSAQHGHLNCLQYVCTHELSKVKRECVCEAAARGGHLDCLQCAHEHGYPIPKNASEIATIGGNVMCLQYIHEHGCHIFATCIKLATERNHADCLRYILLHFTDCVLLGLYVNIAIASSAQFGCVECLKILLADAKTREGVGILGLLYIGVSPIFMAAKFGHLKCLRLLYEYSRQLDFAAVNWKPDANTYQEAAGNGHLNCLQYLHEQYCISKGAYGNPWNSDTCLHAARFGHLDCLKYAHEHGCPWYMDTCIAAYLNSQDECFRYAYINNCPTCVDHELWANRLGLVRNKSVSVSSNHNYFDL
jgi:hypothetical protein